MHKKIQQRWRALDNNLIVDLTLGIDQMLEGARLDNVASAIIYCADDPHTRLLEIYKDVHTDFDYHFTPGIYVRGYLSLQHHRLVDGTEQAGVYGKLHFGHTGHYEEQHFEGFIAIIPLQ